MQSNTASCDLQRKISKISGRLEVYERPLRFGLVIFKGYLVDLLIGGITSTDSGRLA